ncbi:MAG: DMT family transporter [Marmoricola sp.]|nr:DMT family transporter [Marmoricola sp.]
MSVTSHSTPPRTSRSTGAGLLFAVLSAATFATSGPFAKSLLETGWTPGSVVFLRIGGAALLLSVPTVRALRGRWREVARSWHRVALYGAMAVAVPQLAFFYAVEHLSVGVALLLEYLGMVLVVVWQSVTARRLPTWSTVTGVALAIVGLVLVLDVFGGVHVDGVGVLFGLVAACGLASFFLLSEHGEQDSLPPVALAGAGLTAAGVLFAVLGAAGVLPMAFPRTSVSLAGTAVPWWVAVLELAAVAAATSYVSGIFAARLLGAKLASFVGLSEVMFAVLFAWLLLGELPRPVQLLGGVFILAGVVVVRAEERSAAGGSGSEPEPAPLLGPSPLGDLSVVPHGTVELGAVDVAPGEDEVAVVEPGQGERPAPLTPAGTDLHAL